MFKIATAVALMTQLLGCSQMPTKTQMKVVSLPSEMLVRCDVYPVKDKEIASLVEAQVRNYGSLETCNKQLAAIETFLLEQKAIFEN